MNKKRAEELIFKELSRHSWAPDNIINICNILKSNEGGVFGYDAMEVAFVAARVCGTSIKKMKSKSRERNVVRARALCCNELKNKGYRVKEIGKIFNRNYTTVCASIKALKKDIDGKYKPTINALKRFNKVLNM